MSVESEILRIQNNIADAYAKVAEKGGDVPLRPTSENLAAAVGSIPTAVTQDQLNEALAGKQDKLTGAPGQVVGFGSDGVAQAAPGWSNPNLLDNWYFADPINQRGQTEYTAAGYAIDRWFFYNPGSLGSVALTGTGITIDTTKTGNTCQFIQRMEINSIPAGTNITVSLLVDGALYSLTTQALLGAGHSTVTPFGDISFRNLARNDFWEVLITITPGNAINAYAAKLELGAQQTLARQDADGNWVLNDPPPDKALELLKCQRYYQHLILNCGLGVSAIPGIYELSVQYQKMRVNPAVSFIGGSDTLRIEFVSPDSIDIRSEDAGSYVHIVTLDANL